MRYFYINTEHICSKLSSDNYILYTLSRPLLWVSRMICDRLPGNIYSVKQNDNDICYPNLTIAIMSVELIKQHRCVPRLSYPLIDSKDIPNILVVKDKPKINDEEKWEYILEEIIYGLNTIIEPNNYPDTCRGERGLRLFGKYFIHLCV